MSQHTFDVARRSPASSEPEWNQNIEAVKMLNLAVAQLGLCLKHGDDSIETLTDSFTVMAESLEEIKDIIPESESDKNVESWALLNNKCDHLSAKVAGAIMAFQFYDRLSQNLSHVSENMTSLGELMTAQSKLQNPSEWVAFQADIRSRYTMPEEREMFDLIQQGVSAEEAMEVVRQHEAGKEEGDIELF